MSISIDKLTSQIIPISGKILESLPDHELSNVQNYKLFPREILVKALWNYKEEDSFMAEQLLNNIKRNGQIITCQVRLLESGFYEVVDGNHRLDAFNETEQKFIFAYDHGKISQAQAERLSIETNETKFAANAEKLAALLSELTEMFSDEDLKCTIPFTDEEFSNILNQLTEGGFTSDPDINDISEDNFEAPEIIQPISMRGDIYELNNHRILCGDSTNFDDVKKLMDGKKAHCLFTDPPYNIGYPEFNKNRGNNGKDWTDSYCSDWQDAMTDSDYKTFLYAFLRNAKASLIEWAHYYVWHATVYFTELMEAFSKNEIPYDKVPIQWVKQVAPPSHVRYWRMTEPCLYGGKGAINGNGDGARWFGPIGEKNVWQFNREHNGNYIHPTQKPITLAVKAISNSSQKEEIILDMFLGSGSTLIASDTMKRICYGMEFEPKYVDLIVLRYFKYCEDNNISCTVKRNGEIIDKSFFNYPESAIKIKDLINVEEN